MVNRETILFTTKAGKCTTLTLHNQRMQIC